MPKTNEIQFNVKEVKFAIKNADGTYGDVEDLAYADSISLESTASTLPVRGDGIVINTLVSDQGLTGTLSIVQLAMKYEIAMKRKMEVSSGIADVLTTEVVPHAIFYKVDSASSDGAKEYKCWLLNVTSTKPTETYSQNTETPNINNIEIPLEIRGEKLMTSDGTNIYIDNNGKDRTVVRLVCMPGSTEYDTFEDTVPVPKQKEII